MKRVSTPELLDSDACPASEVDVALGDLCRVNRWFGGVATSRALVERVAHKTGARQFSLLEVASGSGDVPRIVAQRLAKHGIRLDVTLLDNVRSHLGFRLDHISRALVADALALPFCDGQYDLVGCNLFAHHLEPDDLARFVREALRVSRRAVLINDLIRHPLHVALVCAGFPLLRSRISRNDGLASVRRAYVPEEILAILSSNVSADRRGQIEVSRHYLFRMGVIVWK
jgi:ubiquinone/menaquinone biosynthesis C-methylase UbiE